MNVMHLLLKRYKRKVNKVIKGGSILSILFALMISLVIPPFNIYADTYINTSNIVGCHIIDQKTVDSAFYNNIQCNFDNYYIGSASFNVRYTKGSNTVENIQVNVSVSGNYVDFLIVTSSQSINRSSIISVTSITGNDIKLVSDNTKNIMWMFPFESLSVQLYSLENLELLSINDLYNYKFAIFNVYQNDNLFEYYGGSGNEYYFIFYIDKNIYNISTLNQYFSISRGTFTDYFYINSFQSNGKTYYLIKATATNSSSGNTTVKYINSNSSIYLPIYFNQNSARGRYISTDFALQFGLSNDLLDSLKALSSGTNESNQSSSDLNNQTSSFDTTSNDLYTSENAFNTDMNNKLQSINTNFDPSNAFGSKFLQSAAWVRTQFDNITNSTPFGTVLSFSMLLGLSLLIIGKVFK